MYTLETMPNNLEAERTLLGCILVDNDHMSTAAERLVPEDFYGMVNREIFSAMRDLYTLSEPIEALGIVEKLKATGRDMQLAQVVQMTSGVPYLKDVSSYVETIKQKSISRAFIKTCAGAITTASADSSPIAEVLDGTEHALYALRDIDKGRMQGLGAIVHESVSEALQRAKEGISAIGLQTGFKDLDHMTGGFQKTDLIILAARPSMGKSAFSLDICKGVTDAKPESVVAYFSLEMSKKQCADRLLCSMAEIDSTRFRTGWLTQDEWERLGKVADDLYRRTIHIDDTPAINALDIKAKARNVAVKEGRLDLIVVDYLQLMTGVKKTDSRQQEVSDISRDLKSIAKEMNVPVLALSQLSRQCESRQDKRPMLSDLRDSGAIEQDADIVAFLYRDEYYNPQDDNQNMAELLVRKHRHGAVGTINLAFFKKFARFGNYLGGINVH